MQPDMPVETALRVYRRYLKLEPSHTEEYIAYLKSKVNPYLRTHSQTQIVSTAIALSVVENTDSMGSLVFSSMQHVVHLVAPQVEFEAAISAYTCASVIAHKCTCVRERVNPSVASCSRLCISFTSNAHSCNCCLHIWFCPCTQMSICFA